VRVGLGNNLVQGDRLVIQVNGEPLLKVARHSNGKILVSLDLWDEVGTHVAKMTKNAWTFNHTPYTVDTRPDHLMLSDGDGRVLVEIQRPTNDYTWIKQLELRTAIGARLLLTDTHNLEVWDQEVRLATLEECAIKNPTFTIDTVDADSEPKASRMAANGIILHPVANNAGFRRCTFGNSEAQTATTGA